MTREHAENIVGALFRASNLIRSVANGFAFNPDEAKKEALAILQGIVQDLKTD